MASVFNLNNDNHTLSYLNAYHCFGRSTTSVDTLIEASDVSRMHAVIQWHDKQWLIRDLSQNGTWINSQKLEKDNAHKLNVGDTVFFGSADAHGFRVQDAD